MLAFICLFFPAVTSVWLFESLAKTEFSLKESIMRFCTNALIINLLCITVKKFFFATGENPLCSEGDMVPNVAFVYIIMALFFAICVTIFEVIFSKKIKSVTAEEVSDEEKE